MMSRSEPARCAATLTSYASQIKKAFNPDKCVDMQPRNSASFDI